MRATIGFFLLHLVATASAFAPSWKTPAQRSPRLSTSLFGASGETTVESLKTELLENISNLKKLQDEDGKIAVDFGVKGGEIDEKSRAPRKLDFYTVSERVGKAADIIFESVEELAKINPTAEATKGMGDKKYEGISPLEGVWSLLFSTAADASFSRDSKRGDATAGNIVDAKNGRMTNVIKFAPAVDEEGNEKQKAVGELRVKLAVNAEGPNRVNLVFKYVAVKFTKFFFLPLRWTLYIPVPGQTIGKLVIGLSNLKRRLLRKTNEPKRELPKAFFDVLFLDKDLRVHKTGEDNLFIQARPEWKAAWETAA